MLTLRDAVVSVIFDLEEVFDVEVVILFQEVTDFFELVESLVRTVQDYVVDHFH